jgi:hypothetical protein
MGEKKLLLRSIFGVNIKKDRKFDIFTTKLIIMLLCACMEVNAINEELKSRIGFHGHIIKLRFENLNEEKKK